MSVRRGKLRKAIALTAVGTSITVASGGIASAVPKPEEDETRQCTRVILVAFPDNFDASSTGDPSNPAGMFGDISTQVKGEVGKRYSTIVPYYTTNIELDANQYEESIRDGTERGIRLVQNIMDGCSKSRVVIGGDGQGAEIAGNILTEIGNNSEGLDIDSRRVEGGILFGDPRRSEGTTTIAGSDQESVAGVVNVAIGGSGLIGARESDFGDLEGKVASFCSDADLRCSASDGDKKNLIAKFGDIVFTGFAANSDKINIHNPTATAAAMTGIIGADALRLLADQTGMPEPQISAGTIEMLAKLGIFAATSAAGTVAAGGVPVIDPGQAMSLLAETNQLPTALSEVAATVGQLPEVIAALPDALPTFYERSGLKDTQATIERIINNIHTGNPNALDGVDLNAVSAQFLPSSAQRLIQDAVSGNIGGLAEVVADPSILATYSSARSYSDYSVGEQGESSSDWVVSYLTNLALGDA